MAAHLPGVRIDSAVLLGAGLDHTAYEVNGELIVRFGGEPEREARLLAVVAGVSPLPVPEPVFVAAELDCLAYAKLPGTPLLNVPRSARDASIAATLGEFLAALHALPIARMAGLVDTDDHPLTEWLREAAATYPTVAGRIPPAHRRSIEAFLAAPPPGAGYTPVFSHNDLGIEHVLVDPETGTVTGVIDWSDAAIVDPARDVGKLYRDLGPTALRADDRAVFHARCGVLEDLAYGVATGRTGYLDKSLAALKWLF
jgi:aminoglycoside phosphotransferase (APT) family kinase protein